MFPGADKLLLRQSHSKMARWQEPTRPCPELTEKLQGLVYVLCSGQGLVYLAWMGEQRVAIKVLRPGLRIEHGAGRFMQEVAVHEHLSSHP